MKKIRYVEINFANPSINSADHVEDIFKAVNHANINLSQRYKIEIVPYLLNNQDVVVEIRIPETDFCDFNPGKRLKGISSYLLNNCRFDYKNYLVGTRLLFVNDYNKTISTKIVSKTFLYESDNIRWYLIGEHL